MVSLLPASHLHSHRLFEVTADRFARFFKTKAQQAIVCWLDLAQLILGANAIGTQSHWIYISKFYLLSCICTCICVCVCVVQRTTFRICDLNSGPQDGMASSITDWVVSLTPTLTLLFDYFCWKTAESQWGFRNLLSPPLEKGCSL